MDLWLATPNAQTGVDIIPRLKRVAGAVWSHMRPEQTIKMTKPVPSRDCLYYRGSRIGIASQFLDCHRVGGQGAEEEEREEKQRRAAELHDRAAAERQALACVLD